MFSHYIIYIIIYNILHIKLPPKIRPRYRTNGLYYPHFKYLNRRFWIEGNDQNSNCALTKNEISHKLRLAVGRGINKSMLEKELSETGRNAKIVLGNESSDEEADEDVDQPAAQQFPVCDMCFGTCRENYLRFVLQKHLTRKI